MSFNHPQTIPLLHQSTEKLSSKTHPWCQKGWDHCFRDSAELSRSLLPFGEQSVLRNQHAGLPVFRTTQSLSLMCHFSVETLWFHHQEIQSETVGRAVELERVSTRIPLRGGAIWRSSPHSLSLYIYLFMWLHRVLLFIVSWLWHSGLVACGILVPQPGIKPMSPALKGGFLTTGPPEKCSSLCSWLWAVPQPSVLITVNISGSNELLER